VTFLKRPGNMHYLDLPPRRARLAAETEVLVVGGGPAGIAAAIGAANAGAKVILVERYGFLGGNATAALVMPLAVFFTQKPDREAAGTATFYPTDHGRGEPVIAGVLRRLIHRLVQAGGALVPSVKTGNTVPFDPEIFKLVAMDLLTEAGVKVLFHAFASDVLDGSSVRGGVFETKSGPVVIKAKMVVDCTGDGDMAAQAGASYEIGRRQDALVQPMTLMFRLVDFEKAGFEAYVKQHPGQWRGVHGLWDLIRKATDAGELNLAREDLLIFGTPHEKELAVNSTRVINVLGTDVWDLTYAEWASRKQMRQIANFLRRHVPGFENSYVAQSGMHIGVRETRRIIGEYQLTAEDILTARKFEDSIAQGSYPIDIHNPEGKGTLLQRLPAGETYDIPLRCLLPRNVDNLLVAGRCISGTHEAHSSYRVMPISMATGQAAGVCAAVAVRSGSSPRNLPVRKVQFELLRQGADLRMAPAAELATGGKG
jgi:hypothetical protein